MPELLFSRGDREILRFPLTAPALKIGRHPSNDLTLPDEEISRFHAQLERKENGYWITDQSRNGTILNGKRIKRSPLKGGDELRMGGWRIVFADDTSWEERETAVQERKAPLPSFCGIIGESGVMRQVFERIDKVAPTLTTVLILGETGTGKEMVARAIHERSPRARRPFVPLNCSAISPQLIESELFGHERGAFTGAISRHAGAFEQASGGTLFLDEVGELPMGLQPKLLRVLEEGRFRRVGGDQEIETDVRVLAATHRNLESLTREGKFREDLFFRLFAVPIPLPPLRERREDIPLLAEYFVGLLQSGGSAGGGRRFSPEAVQRLVDHPWKGNVRELKNVITRSLLFAAGEVIRPEEILFLSEPLAFSTLSLDDAERQAIFQALKESGGNKKKAAETLGIAKSTLFQKLKEYQIKGP